MKYFRLCNNQEEMLKFTSDVKKLRPNVHGNPWINERGPDFYPVYICAGRDNTIGYVTTRHAGLPWLLDNGYVDLSDYKHYRLCKDKAEMLQFLTDVNTLEKVEHTADNFNHWPKENYPAFFCVPKGQQRLGHMPFDDGEVWLKNNGYKELKSTTTPTRREVILTDLQKIFGNVEHLDKNTYYLNGICFFISCMDKDGGVDLKYKDWATGAYLIVSGEGSLKVRDRVVKNYPETKNSIFTFGEFVEKLKGKF